MTDYNKIYKKHKDPFGGGKPAPIVRNILKYKKSGSVIEFGAGTGRNSLFLARSGFNVTAADLSKEAVKILKERAQEQNLTIEIFELDVRTTELRRDYDIIVSTFMTHHLSRDEGEKFIATIKNHTLPGGLNVIPALPKTAISLENTPKPTTTTWIREDLKKNTATRKYWNLKKKKGVLFRRDPTAVRCSTSPPLLSREKFILKYLRF